MTGSVHMMMKGDCHGDNRESGRKLTNKKAIKY